MATELKSAFNDIKPPFGTEIGYSSPDPGYFPPPTPSNRLEQVEKFQVGHGSKTFKMDQDGMWLGGEVFLESPWRIDMDGNMYFNDGTTDRIFIGIESE